MKKQDLKYKGSDVFLPKLLIGYVVAWNTAIWGRAIRVWGEFLPGIDFSNMKVLEIGANKRSAVSLVFADKGADCTLGYYPLPKDSPDHFLGSMDLTLEGSITVVPLDIFEMPYKEEFDIVCMKSILGGISEINDQDTWSKGIDAAWLTVKPGGYLALVENTKGSFMHDFLRSNFRKNSKPWNYFSSRKYIEKFESLGKVQWKTFGFLSFTDFGIKQLGFLLCAIDRLLFERLVSKNGRVVLSLIVQKERNN